MHNRWKSHTVLCSGDILVYNTFFDLITHLTCSKQAEKGTGEKRSYNDQSISDESLAKLEKHQANLENCLVASCDMGAVRRSYLINKNDLGHETNCIRNLTHQAITSIWNHVQSFSGERFMGSTSQVILSLLCLNFAKFRTSQTYLWRPGEHAKISGNVFNDSFITLYTDIILLFLSKEPSIDFRKALKGVRRSYKREEDMRFKPPYLDQDKNQGVTCFILIKEAPPDAAHKPKPSKAQFGIRLLLFDNFLCANLLCFNVSGLSNESGTKWINASYISEPVSSNAYQRGLQGKCNLISNFDVTDLVPSIAGKTDLRTNLFEEGGDDVIMESTKDDVIMDRITKENKESLDEPHEATMHQQPGDDALAIPEGPMTRSRVKKLKENVVGLLTSHPQQEESLGQGLIRDVLITIQAISTSS